jgi:hypothetical protein
LVCSECLQANHEVIFRRGFEFEKPFRSNRDLIETTDGFFCISEKVRNLLQRHRARGFNLKQISNDGWWAVNLTRKVSADNIYKSHVWDGRRMCPECKRAVSVTGLYQFERQLPLPSESRVLFTVKHERQGLHAGPDIFVTEDIVKVLQGAGIRGCAFARLLNLDEEKQYGHGLKAGKGVYPPDGYVDLGAHR